MAAKTVRIFVTVLAALLIPELAAGADAPPQRYTAFPVVSDPKSIWVLDTATGGIEHCEAQESAVKPLCSPSAPAEAMWRFDETTKQIVPANPAAEAVQKERDARRQNSK